jgi:ABC-type glycerol-3-phosphate transport system permease component
VHIPFLLIVATDVRETDCVTVQFSKTSIDMSYESMYNCYLQYDAVLNGTFNPDLYVLECTKTVLRDFIEVLFNCNVNVNGPAWYLPKYPKYEKGQVKIFAHFFEVMSYFGDYNSLKVLVIGSAGDTIFSSGLAYAAYRFIAREKKQFVVIDFYDPVEH